jgi:hypothetical protein
MPRANSEARRISPWVWAGCGCASLILLCALAVGGLIFWGGRQVRRFEAEMRDPQARAAKVDSILHVREMPPGYHAAGGFSIPFLVDIAMLSDREPGPEAQGTERRMGSRRRMFDRRGFVYVVLPSWGSHRQLDDFVEGRGDSPDELRRIGIRVESEKPIERGNLQIDEADLQYVAQRSVLHVDQGTFDGISTLILVRCPGSSRERLGIWFAPDPHPETPVAEANFAGTPADPGEIRRFMSHFSPCGS